ncbi:MAG: 2-dehydropantoate 2-reductase N-terminal domain-containing protein [Dehalococcoidia bacterium]
MRYIIYGAGAVGGAIGGRLFQSGRDVVLIARGATSRPSARTVSRSNRRTAAMSSHPGDERPG